MTAGKLYAIGDAHLGFGCGKSMDIFGPAWERHHEKLEKAWLETIRLRDTVVLNGDISWAMNAAELEPDMDFLLRLPGRKIFVLGNHDYWFDSAAKFYAKYPDIFLLAKGAFTKYEGFHICGTRGWLCPGDRYFKADDLKIYKREALRLEASLRGAMTDGAKDIIVFTHFPPFSDFGTRSEFLDILERYPVRKIVFGHLHGHPRMEANMYGYGGTEFILDSADFLDFKPLRII